MLDRVSGAVEATMCQILHIGSESVPANRAIQLPLNRGLNLEISASVKRVYNTLILDSIIHNFLFFAQLLP